MSNGVARRLTRFAVLGVAGTILSAPLAMAATTASWPGPASIEASAPQPVFPALLAAARVEPRPVETPQTPTRATLAIELFLVLGVSACLARSLPRNRRRRHRSGGGIPRYWAAREMS